ncbi:MAG: NHL repeat-containing protein [candidate division KSB1 bacterium]|jgi:DNA-binding beta-propeller fold protein YncE|nr:NHL repeat-containing protein [candidate division KSB1 bacterium]
MKKNDISRRQFIKNSLVLGSSVVLSSVPLKVFSQPKSTGILKGFNNPYGIAVGPDGLIHVSDSGNYCIKIFSRTGELLRQFGKPGSGGAHLNYPQGIAVDSSGDIYVMDSNNGRIAIFSSDGEFKNEIGTIGGYPGAFYTPKGILLGDDERIYAANTRNHMIYAFDKKSRALIANYGILGEDPENIGPGSVDYRFRLPTDLVISPDGWMYVVDSKHGAVKVLDSNGQFLFKFGTNGSAPGQLNLPEGIAMDRSGILYVCDSLNSRVQRFTKDGTYLDEMSAGFVNPAGICLDADDTIYVVDSGQNIVKIFKWS